MQRSAKMIDSAEMRSWLIVYATMNSVNLYTATRSIRKMEAVQVAEKVLLGALEQLKRAQLFVERAEYRYWKEWAQCKSTHSVVSSESEPLRVHQNKSVQCELYDLKSSTSLIKSVSASVLKVQVSQDGLASPPSPRVHIPSDASAEGDEPRESDSPPSPPSPRAHTPSDASAEGDESRESDSPPSPLSPPSPRAHTPSEACAEGDEPREKDCPPGPPSQLSPRAHINKGKDEERNRAASPRRTLHLPNTLIQKPTCVTAEEDNTTRVEISDTDIANSEQQRKKRNKDCIIQLTRLEEEPKRKKPKSENRFILIDNQLKLSIPAEILIDWITWFWKSPATRGIEFRTPSVKSVTTTSVRKTTSDKKKKSSKNTETEEERERRREKDRIRKREQRKKQKEEALKIRKARVPLIRADVKTSQHSTIPQAPLFTSCTECKEDCWYKGDGLHELPWLLCVVCHTNWANGKCGGRIPYECRICRIKKTAKGKC